MSFIIGIVEKVFGSGGGYVDGGYADSPQGREDQINAGIQREEARRREEAQRRKARSDDHQHEQRVAQTRQCDLQREEAARAARNERERAERASRERQREQQHQQSVAQFCDSHLAHQPVDAQCTCHTLNPDSQLTSSIEQSKTLS